MGARNTKYHMFKNFMHNDLGISREDIRAWVAEAVQDEARRLVSTHPGIVNRAVAAAVNGAGWNSLKEMIARELRKQIVVTVGLKDEAGEQQDV